MGTYIGPLLICQNEIIEKKESVRFCQNEECIMHEAKVWDTSTKFCCKCGSEILPIDIVVKRPRLNVQELAEELGETLCLTCWNQQFSGRTEKGDVWIPNRKGIPSILIIESRDVDIVELITPEQITHAIRIFEQQFQIEIAKLKEMYGNGEVSWGCVAWF